VGLTLLAGWSGLSWPGKPASGGLVVWTVAGVAGLALLVGELGQIGLISLSGLGF
jgi:hypothetical protein